MSVKHSIQFRNRCTDNRHVSYVFPTVPIERATRTLLNYISLLFSLTCIQKGKISSHPSIQCNLTYSHLQCRQTAFFASRKQLLFGRASRIYAQTFFTQVRSLLSSLSSLPFTATCGLSAPLIFKYICIPPNQRAVS